MNLSTWPMEFVPRSTLSRDKVELGLFFLWFFLTSFGKNKWFFLAFFGISWFSNKTTFWRDQNKQQKWYPILSDQSFFDWSDTNSWMKFQSDRSRDKLSTLQDFYRAGRTHGGQKLYIEELYKRKESGTKKVAISFVYVCLYFAGCLLAWPHFWRTLFLSQPNVACCQKIYH